VTTIAPITAAAVETATLTRILLNRNHPAVRKDLADATGLHKTVMRLIPDHLGPHPRQQAGLLFRLEPDVHQPRLLIQTTIPPCLDQLPTRYGVAEARDLSRMFRALAPGMNVRYRITANASTRNADCKVIALYGEAALAWWHRRAAQAGLHIHHADATRQRFQNHRREAGQPYHALTRFEGTATITDPASLTHALLAGIGKGKPYGAGLLTLAPNLN
jgi:CRISPR system Cascade subunit CasE